MELYQRRALFESFQDKTLSIDFLQIEKIMDQIQRWFARQKKIRIITGS